MDTAKYCEEKIQELEAKWNATAGVLNNQQREQLGLEAAIEELGKLGNISKVKARLSELEEKQKVLPGQIQFSMQEMIRLQGEYKAIQEIKVKLNGNE